jgi:hypothetical protein
MNKVEQSWRAADHDAEQGGRRARSWRAARQGEQRCKTLTWKYVVCEPQKELGSASSGQSGGEKRLARRAKTEVQQAQKKKIATKKKADQRKAHKEEAKKVAQKAAKEAKNTQKEHKEEKEKRARPRSGTQTDETEPAKKLKQGTQPTVLERYKAGVQDACAPLFVRGLSGRQPASLDVRVSAEYLIIKCLCQGLPDC